MNSRVGRRQFLSLAGAGAVWGAAGWRTRAFAQDSVASGTTPDLIVVNANVHTVDPRLPHAEAFAVQAGRFLAVGSNEAIRNLARRTTPVFDAQRMTIVPGFIDCHNHAEGETLLYSVLVGNPFDVEFVTIDSIVEKLRQRAAETPPGTRLRFTIAAAIQPSTTVRPCAWRGSPAQRRIPPAARTIATLTA